MDWTPLLEDWTRSRNFNLLNVFLARVKRQQEPNRQKCELRLSDFQQPEIILNGNVKNVLTLTDFRVAFSLGHRLVRESFIELFGECGVREYFYPPEENGRDIRLCLKDGKLSFSTQLPEFEDILASARNAVAQSPKEEAWRTKLSRKIRETSEVMMALCLLAADGHRRAAEFRDFHFAARNEVSSPVHIRPGAYGFLDTRRIAKRASNSVESREGHRYKCKCRCKLHREKIRTCLFQSCLTKLTHIHDNTYEHE